MKISFFKIVLTIALVAAGLADSAADDIDLYEDGPGGNAGVPNLLIVLDNAANFDASTGTGSCTYADGSGAPSLDGTLAGIEQCAIFNAVYSLPVNAINLGLMGYNTTHFTQFGCPSGGNGGCLLQPLTLLTTANKQSFLNFVKTWSLQSSNPNYMKANGEATAAAMQEAWAYYAGQTGLSGRNYAGIQPGSGCQKNFVVFIGNAYNSNGTPGDGSSVSPSAALKAAPGSAAFQSQITTTYPAGAACNTANPYYKMPNHTDSSGLWADEWANYMYGTDIYGNLEGIQNIQTYTIGVLGAACKPDYPALLTSMAAAGHGRYYSAYTYDELYKAFLNILNEVQAINSVFASSSLPVSANSQGTYLNQVFIGMFRPDASGNPRWLGNLKQYQFGVTTTTSGPQLFLADARTPPQPAISASTGFISPNAVSFWTKNDPTTLPDNIGPTGGFWINSPSGTPLSGFDSPDGEVVEKGSVAQQIRLAELTDNYSTSPSTPHDRNLYTCTSSSGWCTSSAYLSDTPFSINNNDITAATLGASTPGTGIASIAVSFTSPTASTATAKLTTTPTPALTAGQAYSMTISGSQYQELNGPYTVVATAGDTFTYTPLPTDPPASTNTPYVASVPSAPVVLSSLTSSGSTATATVQGSNPFASGQWVTIASTAPAAPNQPYYTTVQIASVSGNSFTYPIVTGPATPSTGGQVKIGSTSYNITNLTRSGTEVDVTISYSGKNPTGSTATISGTSIPDYNNTWNTTPATGKNCPNAANGVTFCFTITTTPSSTDTDAGLTAAGVATPIPITNLTRGTPTCSGTYAGRALVTATTSANPMTAFAAGSWVTVGGSGPSNESAYTSGSGIAPFPTQFQVQSISNTSFTYYVKTSPGCSDSPTNSPSLMATPAGINRTDLINWVRGDDNQGDELGPGNGVTVRPSVHGDVLHSRPLVVNYGSSIGVVVFYGGNDGVFRAINGNQPLNGSLSIGGVPPGGEIWGFIPREFFGKLQRQAANIPALKLANTSSAITPTPQPKDYFFDGSTSVYQTSSAVYIYLSARRGGRLIYALDVTDPAKPKFMWKKGCPNLNDNTNCDAGFAELGQTWSTPKAAIVKGYSNPVLIFGAGYYGGQTYDTTSKTWTRLGEDAEPPAADTMGRGIFILDAITGAIVWQASSGGSSNSCSGTPCQLQDMKYSVAADVTLMNINPSDTTGIINRLYAADTGGNIWRVDLEPTAGNTPAFWQVTKFASLGGSTGAGSYARKFLYPPDVVVTKTFDLVIAGTGDREHPLYSAPGTSGCNATCNVVNRMYVMKDMKVGPDALPWSATDTIVDDASATSASAPSNLAPASPTGLFNATSTPYDGSGKGYYIVLQNTGEKVVNAPVSVGGFAYMGTNQPPAPSQNSCSSSLGTALGYQINLFTGSTESVTFERGGLPPSPVAGLVQVTYNGKNITLPFLLGGGNPSPNCSGPDCTSFIGGGKPPIPVLPIRKRVYWYLDKHDN